MWTELRKSLRENLQRVRRYWVVLILTWVGSVLGLVSLVADSLRSPVSLTHPSPLISPRVWLPLFISGIVIAEFLAFHDVRKERDTIKREMMERLSSIRYRLKMTALSMQIATENNNANNCAIKFMIHFTNGSQDAIAYSVESISISLDGHTVSDPQFYSRGGLILPGWTETFNYPFISDVPRDALRKEGFGEYVVNYGHPTDAKAFVSSHRFHIYPRTIVGQEWPSVCDWIDEGEATHEPTT